MVFQDSSSKKIPNHAWSQFPQKWDILRDYGWPKKSRSLQLRVGFCLLLLIVGRLVNVALPLYNKWIVNALNSTNPFDYSLIYWSVFLKFLQGSGSMGGCLSSLRSFLWIPVKQYTYRELEIDLFAHLHSLPMQWHVNREIGLVLKAANRGTHSVAHTLTLFLFHMLPTVADFIIAVIFFASNFNPYFGVIVFVTLTSHLTINIGLTEWRTKFRRGMNTQENKMGAIGTDSLLNFETVKYYGNETFEISRYRDSIVRFQVDEWLNNATLSLLKAVLHGVLAIGTLVGSCLAAYLITVTNTLTVGDYVLFTTYFIQLYSPLNKFGDHYRIVQKAMIDMENMISLFGETPEKDDLDAVEYVHQDGAISVEKVAFAYDLAFGPNIIDGVSFNVEKGQKIALIGLSGSGKTSITRLLYRLYDFSQGSIRIDGTDIRKLKAKTLRRHIGIVPQDTFLFNESILYNIKYGNLEASDEDIVEAAKAAMIHDKIISLPQGYDTIVGDRGMKLSGGEKQRLAIARTMLKKPEFIFLDEATSALDIHTERAIQQCLDKLCLNRTCLVVAHRLSTIVNADCIFVMHKGRIVESGTHDELMAKEGIYFDMYQCQRAERTSTNSLNSD